MRLLPIDLHAHVSADIEGNELKALDAVVFSAMPSLNATSAALRRRDSLTVWGVGCHPGLVRSQEAFDVEAFRRMMMLTPYVSEVGLDGSSRVPLKIQIDILLDVLSAVQRSPRIVSLHSYRATAELLSVLRRWPAPGFVLHWWLGTPEETIEAVRLGCYFSVNASSARRRELLDLIPISRILTETDHPAGDRFGGPAARPGNVDQVEELLASHYELGRSEIRETMWLNLDRLVLDTGVGGLLPRELRVRLGAL